MDRPWTLVGRGDDLAYLSDARRSKPPRAVVLGGAQGVGRSRLAEEALAEARAERWATERIHGDAAAAAVPLGAVAHLAAPDSISSADPLRLLVSVTEQLRLRAARRPLMLVVDDAQDLDEASLAVLQRVVATPNLFLLVTIRSDQRVPPPVVSLWKDGHADRLELEPLTQEETYRLVGDVLGGEVDATTLRWLWNHCLGNPLFLRELMLAERGRGWRRLVELVESRMGALDADERSVLEMLTVCGPLPCDLLAAIVAPSAVASVVGHGLASERDPGVTSNPLWGGRSQDVVVSVAHPIYERVLAERISAVRARTLRDQLLGHLAAVSDPTLSDAVRLVTLRLDHGSPVDTHQVALAAVLVLTAYPRALAARLGADRPALDEGADVGPVQRSSRLSFDSVAVAARLARTAWEAEPDLVNGLTWVGVLTAQGDAAAADAVTAELEGLARNEWERTWVILARASLQFWVRGKADEAAATLLAAEEAADNPHAAGRLRRERAGIALNVGRVGEAVATAEDIMATADPNEALAAMAAATGAAGLALSGRPAEAADLVDRFIPVAQAHVNEVPEILGQLMLSRQFAARVLGRLDEAEWLSYACYQAGVDNGSLDAMGIYTGALGQVALDRGRLTTAVRRLRESDILLRERDIFGYRPWVLAGLATALAQLGQAEEADRVRCLVGEVSLQPRYFDPELVLAAAWCHAAAGRMDAAAAEATAAAESARGRGVHAFEVAALHALTRFGRSGSTASRIAELATAAASPLWHAYAAHARAAEEADPVGLDAVSEAFEQLGLLLPAAEAAAAAAGFHATQGSPEDSARATHRALRLAEGCEGAQTPALRLAARVPWLSQREQEVAVLAADGLSNKAIAERLVVSPRTVESHLYRTFAKLGITDRAQLVTVLSDTQLPRQNSGRPTGGASTVRRR